MNSLARCLVGELDPHSPVVGHPGSIEPSRPGRFLVRERGSQVRAVTAETSHPTAVRPGPRLGQQIRGSGSPTSMSTMRVPPRAVSSSTSPAGSARTSPSEDGLPAEGVRTKRGERLVGRFGGHDRDQLALVRHVERIDPEDLAGGRDRGPDGQRALVEDDRERPPPRQAR